MLIRTCLVAGGAGFIGSALCAELLHKGYRVLCVDNFASGSRQSIAPLLDNEHFSLIEQDIQQELDVAGVDFIFNLACPASPVHYRENPVGTLCTSVLGNRQLLELAKRNDAPLLFTSTSEVYGDPEVHPQPESYWGNVNPIGPRSCYDEGKRAAEALCVSYREQYGMDVRIVRLFNVYGPGMAFDDGRVISNFMVQSLRGEKLTVYGDGLQTRSLCFLSDIVGALILSMECATFPDSPVNLGNPDEHSILELAHLVLEVTASNSPIEFFSESPGDPRRRKPVIDLAASALGWHPTVGIAEGLEKTAEYYRSALSKGCGRFHE